LRLAPLRVVPCASCPAMADRLQRASRRTIDVPSLPSGTVLSLDGSDWSYGRGQRPGTRFTLVVSRVRTELSACYGGEWAWVDGHTPDCGDRHEPCRQALVRAAALRATAVAILPPEDSHRPSRRQETLPA
jgi:hypothetical protein